MKRLTERVGENGRTVIYVGEHKQYDDGDIPCEISDAAKREILKRLAAYEDTGLDPEQVVRARDTLECFDNIGIKRGNEIVKAEQEGRLVVLPCKVGDRVWGVEFDTSECPHCFGFGGCYGCSGAKPKGVYYFKFRLQDAEKIGKTVFLTREEAEAALKGVSEDA